jgi:hypothetical protein
MNARAVFLFLLAGRLALRTWPNGNRALETCPTGSVGLHWITRDRLVFHVNFLAGKPTAQDDAVEPGLVRRDVITALHERSEGVSPAWTSYSSSSTFDVVAASQRTEFLDKIRRLVNKNLSSKRAVDVASNETLQDGGTRTNGDPLGEGQVDRSSAIV